ncbi:hypothetical protein [Flavobacterium caeni]|uniref:Intein N-terminal splicing region n=1 Tax=Flavobacterium caeni TaxID=490189 RepID=A0A1G5KQ96_9FLAO|nr:hypothetical protein [Flavobacterium caeni]SCZ02742.1 hypothetical protein SAMN02927903_03415 [Flavobacterium caeni]
MKSKLVIIILCLSISAFAQKSSEEKYAERNSICKHKNKYSIQDRKSFYPFNKASNILLISFDDPEVLINELPISNQILDSTKVKEIKSLTHDEINNLSDILYNFGFINDKFPKIIDEANCYNPRNAILFIDEKSKIYEYIEICFSCNKIEFSSKEIKTWDNCTEKNDLIRKFFKSKEFKVGVDK